MRVGVVVGVPVGGAVFDGVGVAVGVRVDVAVGVGVRVGVWLGVTVGVFVAVAVLVAVRVAVSVGVIVGVVVGVGVSVGPTKMLPLPGVHGTGVSLTPGRRAKPQSVTCSGLFPFACPRNVTFTMPTGAAGATGVGHANEQMTRPTGGVGPGVAHAEKQLVKGD